MIKILVVEDDPAIALDIKIILSKLGYEILGPTHKFQNAIDILKNNTVDLALIDINLASKKSGIDLAHEINASYDLPFIFLTSYSDQPTIVEAAETLPAAYIVKPFKEQDLYPAIEVALKHRHKKGLRAIHNLESINKKLVAKLTKTEYEIILLLNDGKSVPKIAEFRFNSENTIKTHIKNIYSKLQVNNRIQMIAKVSK